MTDNVDEIFGGRSLPPRPSFTERVSTPSAGRAAAEPAPLPDLPAEQTAGSGLYKPYGYLPANTVGESCEVRGWVAGTDIPQGIVFQYRFLMQVGYVGEEMLKLSFPDCIVVMEGKHLGDLRQKLARRMVTFVQEYHPKCWPIPQGGELIVGRIEVMGLENHTKVKSN